MKKILSYCLIIFIISCEDVSDSISKATMSDYLIIQINDIDYDFNVSDKDRFKENKISNIIIGEDDQAEVRFISDEILKYKIQSNYVVLDSMQQANFLGEINLQVFNEEGVKTHSLFSEKAVVITEMSANKNEKYLEKVVATDFNDKVKIEWEEEDYILEADTIILHYNASRDGSKYFEGIGNIEFSNEGTWMTGYRFKSDFNMESWNIDKVKGNFVE